MDLQTLCRAKVDGIEYKIVRVCWTGRGGGYTYRVYRNRRKVNKVDLCAAYEALALFQSLIGIRVNDLDERSKQ